MIVDFTGKTVVVTGGANGIGNAAARLFAESGANVWILDREKASVAGARFVAADVSDPAAIDRALDAVLQSAGSIDVAAINAGIVEFAPLLETGGGTWDRVLSVNLSGAFHTLKAVAARMAQARKGAVVFTASTNSFDGESELTAYNATKSGLLGLVRTAANELGPYGIRVNAVCPGLIRTRITAAHFGNAAALKDYFRQIPLGRGGDPPEVASAIAFLASDAASYITGATLFVDGGQMATKFGTWSDETAEFDGSRWKLR